jgi:hypothetical protein
MKRLETLRQQMEDAFVDGRPEALQLSRELDKLIAPEQTAMLHQDGTIHINVEKCDFGRS